MEKIFEHHLADLFFDKSQSYFLEVWKSATEDASGQDYIDFQLQKLEHAKKCLPQYFLCDTRNFLIVLTDELQEWTDKNVTLFWDTTPLRKVAFLMSKEMISQLSLELTMDESSHKYGYAYFADEKEATDWLFLARS
jgi:hypothetical protein